MTSRSSVPSRRLLRKVLLNVALCVAVLVVGGAVFVGLASLKQPPESRPQVEKIYNVEVFDVERTNLQEIISSFGTARAYHEVVLSAQVAGEIMEIHPSLKIGQPVQGPQVRVGAAGQSQRSPGDLLVRIDPNTYQERVIQAKNRLAEDDAELKRLKQEQDNNSRMLKKVEADLDVFTEEYERFRSLRKTNAVTKSQLARARLELQQYEESIIKYQNERELFPLRLAQIARRRATHASDLELAQLDLERTAVRPPFDGTLSEVMVERGQYVQVGAALVRLTDTSQVEIPVPLTLRDYAKIEPRVMAGEHPRVLLAENETARWRWSGYVVRVAPQADELTRTVNVFVHVENGVQTVPLLPGTFVHSRIDGPVLEQTLVIPRDAIVGGKIFVADKLRAAARTLTIERTLQSLAVVTAGLFPGEKVILTNLDIIHDGAHVEIQSHRKLADELKRQRTQIARETLAGGGSAAEGGKIN